MSKDKGVITAVGLGARVKMVPPLDFPCASLTPRLPASTSALLLVCPTKNGRPQGEFGADIG